MDREKCLEHHFKANGEDMTVFVCALEAEKTWRQKRHCYTEFPSLKMFILVLMFMNIQTFTT